jgi:hypothetical protein
LAKLKPAVVTLPLTVPPTVAVVCVIPALAVAPQLREEIVCADAMAGSAEKTIETNATAATSRRTRRTQLR